MEKAVKAVKEVAAVSGRLDRRQEKYIAKEGDAFAGSELNN
jgi:hypothetical protein